VLGVELGVWLELPLGVDPVLVCAAAAATIATLNSAERATLFMQSFLSWVDR
jgi:hypothetical protein